MVGVDAKLIARGSKVKGTLLRRSLLLILSSCIFVMVLRFSIFLLLILLIPVVGWVQVYYASNKYQWISENIWPDRHLCLFFGLILVSSISQDFGWEAVLWFSLTELISYAYIIKATEDDRTAENKRFQKRRKDMPRLSIPRVVPVTRGSSLGRSSSALLVPSQTHHRRRS